MKCPKCGSHSCEPDNISTAKRFVASVADFTTVLATGKNYHIVNFTPEKYKCKNCGYVFTQK